MTNTYNSNIVASDPNQYFALTVTFSEGTFSWSVVAKRQDGQTGNVTRNNIYGLTVTIGGNSTYIGDISWQSYTVGSTLRSGTVQLANCTVNNGAVAITLSGNFWYGTWNTAYRCTISESITIVSPTVTLDPNYTTTGDYNGALVGGVTQITFSMSATPGTSGNTITGYRLLVDGVVAYNGASSSGTITAPSSAGTHDVVAQAIESNGAVGNSSAVTITTVLYTAPTFVSVNSVRWSTSDSSGEAADDGTHAKLTPTYTKSKIGNTEITTYCDVTISNGYQSGVDSGTVSASGTSLYTGAVLLDTESYTVMYSLYDDYSQNRVVRTDTISIGGRGFDMIHQSLVGYGVATGMKATAGYLDTALPFRVNTIDSSGNVTAQAVMGSTPTSQGSKVTRSSGLTIKSQSLYTFGRIAFLSLILNGSGSYSAGGIIFQGSVADIIPKGVVTGGGIYGSCAYAGWITGNGDITARCASSVTFSSDVYLSFMYEF